MAIVQEINSNLTALCGNIYIEDLTTYGTVTPDTREDFGIALFFGIDNSGSGVYDYTDTSLNNLSNPGDNSTMGTWMIPIQNVTQNYEIKSYWAPIWESGGGYSAADIVYYYESDLVSNFWINVDGAGATAPASASPGVWLPLDETNYAEFATALLTGNLTYEYDEYISVIKCPDYKVILKECDGVHRLIDNTNNGYDKRYTVTDYNGNTEIDTTNWDLGTVNYVDITVSEDKVYIITIENEIAGVWEEVAQIPLYEYCKTKTCFTYAVDKILCNEWDPCCDNCDDEAILKKERQRLMINQLIALYGTLYAYIHEDSVEYLDIMNIDQDRSTFLGRISSLMEKIVSILERCELCQGAWDTVYNKTVSGSSYKPCNC